MAKEFCTYVAQRKDNRNFSWVIRGLGEQVVVTRVEATEKDEQDDEFSKELAEDEWEYGIYHTGPDEALYAVPGEGFVFPDSPQNEDGEPIPRPWEP